MDQAGPPAHRSTPGCSIDVHRPSRPGAATARRAKSAKPLGCMRCAVCPASSISISSQSSSSRRWLVVPKRHDAESVPRPTRRGTVSCPGVQRAGDEAWSSCANNACSRLRFHVQGGARLALEAGAEVLLLCRRSRPRSCPSTATMAATASTARTAPARRPAPARAPRRGTRRCRCEAVPPLPWRGGRPRPRAGRRRDRRATTQGWHPARVPPTAPVVGEHRVIGQGGGRDDTLEAVARVEHAVHEHDDGRAGHARVLLDVQLPRRSCAEEPTERALLAPQPSGSPRSSSRSSSTSRGGRGRLTMIWTIAMRRTTIVSTRSPSGTCSKRP